MRFFIAFLAFLSISNTTLALDLDTLEYTGEEVAEDIAYIRDAIVRHHPNAFEYADPLAFQRYADADNFNLAEPLSFYDAYYILQTVASYICDGNTWLDIPTTHLLETRKEKIAYPDFSVGPDAITFLGNTEEASSRNVYTFEGTKPAEVFRWLYRTAAMNGCGEDRIFDLSMAKPETTKLAGALFGFPDEFHYFSGTTQHPPENDIADWVCCSMAAADYAQWVDGTGQTAGAAVFDATLWGFVPRSPLKFADGHITDALRGSYHGENSWLDSDYLLISEFDRDTLDLELLLQRIGEVEETDHAHLIVDLSGNVGRDWTHLETVLESFGLPLGWFAPFWYERLKSDTPHFHPSDAVGEHDQSCDDVNIRLGYCVILIEADPDVPSSWMQRFASVQVLIDQRTGGAALALARILRAEFDATLIGSTLDRATRSQCLGPEGFFDLPNLPVRLMMPFRCIQWFQQMRSPLAPDIPINPGLDASGKMVVVSREALIRAVSRITRAKQEAPPRKSFDSPWRPRG